MAISPTMKAVSEGKKGVPRLPVFSFVPYGPVRDSVELAASAFPGASILVFFMVAVGLPTILTKEKWFAASYIPVSCLLPLVIGMISPLVLEWVRASHTVSLRRGIICSMLSGFFGAIVSLGIIFIASLLNGTSPFGSWVQGTALRIAVMLMIVVVATVLSGAGGAVLMMFIKKMPHEGEK